MTSATATQGQNVPPAKRKRKRISPLELVMSRNNHYKYNHYTLTGIFLGSLLLNIALGTIVTRFYMLNTGERVYFATSPEGKLLKDIPLTVELRSEKEIQQYAIRVAELVTSFNYQDYRSVFQNAQEYLTDRGFDNYLQALDQSGNLRTVINGQFVAHTKAVGEVEVKPFNLSDRKAWYADVPVNTTYVNLEQTIVQPLTVHMLIGRVSLATSDNGIQVAQIYLRDRKEKNAKKS